MSRIGRQTIKIPENVTVTLKDQTVEVTGPLGTLSLSVRPEIQVKVEEGQIKVSRLGESKKERAWQGLTRSLLNNMILGITQGFSKTLKLVGTGYRARLEGEKLVLSLGFSHSIEIEPKSGIKFTVEGNETIEVSGIDKALVGQVAAKLRAIKPPDSYKGKGIRYKDEVVVLKPGKAGKAGAAGFGAEGKTV